MNPVDDTEDGVLPVRHRVRDFGLSKSLLSKGFDILVYPASFSAKGSRFKAYISRKWTKTRTLYPNRSICNKTTKKYEPYRQICSNDRNYEPFDEKSLEIRTLRSN